ncbi:MAG: hypothetical protein IKV48_05790 [Eggerthellaceae bacterium]|nr:hypothetical protein [Eggerthellaceae bacterium]
MKKMLVGWLVLAVVMVAAILMVIAPSLGVVPATAAQAADVVPAVAAQTAFDAPAVFCALGVNEIKAIAAWAAMGLLAIGFEVFLRRRSRTR